MFSEDSKRFDKMNSSEMFKAFLTQSLFGQWLAWIILQYKMLSFLYPITTEALKVMNIL